LFVVVIQLCPTEQAVKEGAKSAEEEFVEEHGEGAVDATHEGGARDEAKEGAKGEVNDDLD
jgi:hypothetical protein